MKNSIFQNNEGISPVLGFILMLAIGVTILSTVQLTFVPVWNTQEELNHLMLMQDDFKVLKSNIDSGILGGTTLSSPLIMGFKYSPKMMVYNPKDEAYASLEVRKDAWVEVRYNEVFPEGMTDDTSIKNVSTGMMIYALQGARNYNAFVYENGLIRRKGSNFTTSSQTVLANGTIYLPSVKALDYGSLSGVEKKTVNIYPTSQQKNSVIGKNVWIILRTDPDYVEWWTKTLVDQGASLRKKDPGGLVIANVSSNLVIKMGEAYISAAAKASPAHSPPSRLVRVSSQTAVLPVDGVTDIIVEVQDEYNNPVPNVLVSFSRNPTKVPGNSYPYGELLQSSAVSGSDGRASVSLKTAGAGFYYVNATIPEYNTTFAYAASSQGTVMELDYVSYGPDYNVTATLKDSLGANVPEGTQVTFETGDGLISSPKSTAGGIANTTLNVSDANGTKITNIKVKDTSAYTANITWDTINNITVTAKSGYVFNSRIIPTTISTTGCVMYGTSPGVYPDTSLCDTGSSHSASLTGLSADTAYYFIVNGSRPGKESVNSTEYMFVTGTAIDDGVPPASISNLIADPAGLFINLTWNDPLDLDFDHVEIYIDGSLKATPGKGAESFNAYYFLPGTWHSIATRTVDSTGRKNETWVYGNATTTSLFTYVYGFNDTTGLTTSPDYAKNATDGLYAVLSEEPVGGSNQSDRPTNPIKTITNGTQGGVSYTPSNLTDSDGAIDITIPDFASGAHTYDTSMTDAIGAFNNAPNPRNLSYTAGVGATVMVLNIFTATTTARAGGAPTFKSKTMTQVGTRQQTAGSPSEGAVEMWYLLLDPSDTGSAYTVSVPNTGSLLMRIHVSTYKSATGASALDVYAQRPNTGTTEANPSQSITTTMNGDVLVDALFDGRNQLPTNSYILIFNQLGASYSANSQYYLQATAGAQALSWTVAADDFALITAAFKVVPNYYSLNITYNFTETNSSSSWQSISIQDSSYADALADVSIFNAVSGIWESIRTLAFTGGTTLAQHVNTVVGASGNASNYDADSGQIKIKYNWTGSTQNNTLGVDLLNVTVNYAAGGVYKLNITSNTTGIPNSTNNQLQIKYYVSGDNFTLQVWNGAAFVNRTTLNKTSPDYYNYTLSSNELKPDGKTTDGTVGDIDQNYVLVRYVDLTSNGVQGNLYLDYQRVYSW